MIKEDQHLVNVYDHLNGLILSDVATTATLIRVQTGETGATIARIESRIDEIISGGRHQAFTDQIREVQRLESSNFPGT
jgi:hypothetical protein